MAISSVKKNKAEKEVRNQQRGKKREVSILNTIVKVIFDKDLKEVRMESPRKV